MLTRRERIMLHVLMWTIIAAAVGTGGYLIRERHRDLQSRIRAIEEQLDRFQRKPLGKEELLLERERLLQEIGREASRFYRVDEIDPYRFANTVRELLSQNGLTIRRYQTIEISTGTLLEFSVEGDSLRFFSFLAAVADSPKYWSIPTVSLSTLADGQRISAVFRITYETIE